MIGLGLGLMKKACYKLAAILCNVTNYSSGNPIPFVGGAPATGNVRMSGGQMMTTGITTAVNYVDNANPDLVQEHIRLKVASTPDEEFLTRVTDATAGTAGYIYILKRTTGRPQLRIDDNTGLEICRIEAVLDLNGFDGFIGFGIEKNGVSTQRNFILYVDKIEVARKDNQDITGGLTLAIWDFDGTGGAPFEGEFESYESTINGRWQFKSRLKPQGENQLTFENLDNGKIVTLEEQVMRFPYIVEPAYLVDDRYLIDNTCVIVPAGEAILYDKDTGEALFDKDTGEIIFDKDGV